MKAADSEIQQETCPVKAIYDYATLGLKIRMGGEITVSKGIPGLLQSGYRVESQM